VILWFVFAPLPQAISVRPEKFRLLLWKEPRKFGYLYHFFPNGKNNRKPKYPDRRWRLFEAIASLLEIQKIQT
jgi:hypothetical protein